MEFDDHSSFSWLKSYAPEFKMNGEKISVLAEPQEFYTTLTERIMKASRRVAIASLYIGSGKLEQQLVTSLIDRVELSKSNLQVRILLDYTRGSRGVDNSRTILLPLLKNATNSSSNVSVALYHTPDLRGLLKYFVPDRWNEVFGLAHMKVYVTDDSVIMSGANLSNDYFTNRQDRYVMLEDKNIADFFDSLVATISTFSLQLQEDNSVKLSETWDIHPFKGDYQLFISKTTQIMQQFIASWRSKLETKVLDESFSSQMDTRVYPLIQIGPLKINNDSKATAALFQYLPPSSKVYLATGYFNLTSHYAHLILNLSKGNFSIVTAAPRANGFFGANGIAGFIPTVYTYIIKLFMDRVESLKQNERIIAYEYEKPDYTFHAKGLWLYLPEDLCPSMTLIGSPNFGYRSVHKDLEAQVAIVTENEQLRKRLHMEQQRLFSQSLLVTSSTFNHPERFIPLGVKLFVKLFRNFF